MGLLVQYLELYLYMDAKVVSFTHFIHQSDSERSIPEVFSACADLSSRILLKTTTKVLLCQLCSEKVSPFDGEIFCFISNTEV